MRAITQLVAAVAVALIAAACSSSEPERELSFSGPADDAIIGVDDLENLEVEVTATSEDPEHDPRVDDLRVHLDGEDRTEEADVSGDQLRWRPTDLADGEHHLVVLSDPDHDVADDEEGGDEEAGGEDATSQLDVLAEWRFTVDTTPPELQVTSPDGVVVAGEELTIAGSTEPGATVTVAGHEVTAGDDGDFEHTLDEAPQGGVELSATDQAGNTAELEHPIAIVRSRVESDEVRAVHVSFYGWVSSLREPILEMVENGQINAVQLDLKDEAGEIAYDTEVELANEIGASIGIWDLEEAVDELHGLGVPVIGRIVAFADPVLTRWAWKNGERDWVIQDPSGERYTGRYDGFSNFAHPEVMEYNLAVAEEAARAGVDHILWDYLRRPDGSLDKIVIPGLEGTPEEGVVEFTRLADERLEPYGVQHGASVFGIAADRPTQIGQDIEALADHLDYVAPMIYPSHWGPGEYGVVDPNSQPYDIITETLKVWKEAVDGRRARIVPWLEDTAYRSWNRREQVREQIRAARDAGIDEWLIWDPNVKYTVDAYEAR